MSNGTWIVVASGRAKSPSRVKLRVLSPTVTVIVGSSACARPGSSNRHSRIRTWTMFSPRVARVNSLQHTMPRLLDGFLTRFDQQGTDPIDLVVSLPCSVYGFQVACIDFSSLVACGGLAFPDSRDQPLRLRSRLTSGTSSPRAVARSI